MSIHYRIENSQIVVFGNTYPHKEKIKSLGARFNGSDKTWMIPLTDEKKDAVDKMCQGLGGGFLGASPTEARPALKMQTNYPKVEIPKDSITVSDLMNRVQAILTSGFPLPVWIVGEVQNVSKKNSAVFLSIAEPKKDAEHSSTITIKATLWRSKLKEIAAIRGKDIEDLLLTDGTQIRLLAGVQLYRDRGHVTLNILDLDPSFTKGALALAREKLLKELRAKGLDTANKKRSLSPFPFDVGLISAEGSRAHSDFTDQLVSYGFPGQVHFVSAQMQGERVSDDVSKAIKQLEKHCDVIVVTRGGGSAADLRWFDDQKIALAIAEAKVPIVAAIGHHDDVSVAEEICYLRQKTPTAAADYIIHVFDQTKRRLDESSQGLARILQQRVDLYEQIQSALPEKIHSAVQNVLSDRYLRLERAMTTLGDQLSQKLSRTTLVLNQLSESVTRASEHFLSQKEKFVLTQELNLNQSFVGYLQRAKDRLMNLHSLLKGLDPSPWLSKGWTQLLFEGQKVKKSVKEIKSGEAAKAVFLDGEIEVEIKSIEERR